MSTGFGNVYFLGVARIEGKSIVVGSYAYHSQIDISAVKQLLDQPNMNIAPKKYYNFETGENSWHLTSGIYIFSLPMYFVIFC